MKSEAARLVTVRHVTQENQGKDTAGIDGVKSLTAKDRLAMVFAIHPNNWSHQTPQPARRVWIPKGGTTEKRPLAILPMIDRCKQALAKLALEPEWEVKFESQSYGFRPERGTHDAIAAISQVIKHQPVFVFEADIEGAFDNVRHEAVLDKLNTYPALRQPLAVWLKAGVMDGERYLPTEKGLPQGSGLSPLLLNVALHGMATVVAPGGPANAHKGEQPLLVRYADDIVLLHPHLRELQQAIRRVTQWLATMGLHFHPCKTHVSHTLIPFQGNVGFDFLGFTLRQIAIGKTSTFQTVLTPTDEAKRRHLTTIEHRLHQLQTASQAQVIKELNPLIGGWVAYYKGVTSLAQYDDLLWHMLMNWVSQRHPDQERRWLLHCYWRRVGQRWGFATSESTCLRAYSQTNHL